MYDTEELTKRIMIAPIKASTQYHPLSLTRVDLRVGLLCRVDCLAALIKCGSRGVIDVLISLSTFGGAEWELDLMVDAVNRHAAYGHNRL